MSMSIRLVQLRRGAQRRVALVEEPKLHLVRGFESIYTLAQQGTPKGFLFDELLDYDDVYHGRSDWQLLSPIDHPDEPARLLISGTGLTHLGSARDRQAMHLGTDESALSDSMRMFRWGIEHGKPPSGQAGIAPEWFYKGNGTIVRAHNEPLDVPAHSEDGGEEAEIAGVYVISPDGQPVRIGMTIGNEFSDHVFEKKNYLNLAGSKLRTCALGPELVIDPQFQSVPGKVTLERDGKVLWSHDIITGEQEMCHSLANTEHHHFKFDQHRRPGDVHVHFFGACSLSFGQGISLQDKDLMQISFEGFGRPLRNWVRRWPHDPQQLVQVLSIT